MEPDPKSGIKPNPKLGVKTWGQCGHEKKKKKMGSKLPWICLTRYIHSFYCESSLRYGDGKNSRNHQNLWWKY